jgi:hypothetical protein
VSEYVDGKRNFRPVRVAAAIKSVRSGGRRTQFEADAARAHYVPRRHFGQLIKFQFVSLHRALLICTGRGSHQFTVRIGIAKSK